MMNADYYIVQVQDFGELLEYRYDDYAKAHQLMEAEALPCCCGLAAGRQMSGFSWKAGWLRRTVRAARSASIRPTSCPDLSGAIRLSNAFFCGIIRVGEWKVWIHEGRAGDSPRKWRWPPWANLSINRLTVLGLIRIFRERRAAEAGHAKVAERSLQPAHRPVGRVH